MSTGSIDTSRSLVASFNHQSRSLAESLSLSMDDLISQTKAEALRDAAEYIDAG